jgi:hypothetical protein
VVVEPVRAHGFMPIARDFVDPAASVGATSLGVGGGGVDGRKSCQHEWIVVVIELVGEEVCAGEPVIFRAVMSVVLVRGKRISAKAVVLSHVGRQAIVVAEEDRFSIASQHQLGRNRAVESPNRVWLLRRHAGMELQRNRRSWIDAGIQAGWNLRM